MRLRDLNFADLYLGDRSAWLCGGDIANDPLAAPPEMMDDVRALRALCQRTGQQRREFSVRYDGVAYRVSLIQTMNEEVYVLRRFPKSVPKLESLGLHPGLVNKLLTPKLTGLIMVAGAFAQGKTTTASAVIVSRLHKFGGVAITIEDPPEMPLEGQHGQGVCYQTWCEHGQFGESLRHAARWAPHIIFVGEVRDAETASEALITSINGRLVVCTIHADNVISAIERLFALANSAGRSSDDVSSLMSKGLACVLHQRLEGNPRRPIIEFLYLKDDESAGARSQIKARRLEQLGNEISLQATRLRMVKELACPGT